MPAYVTIRAPRRLAALDIETRSELLADTVMSTPITELAWRGTPFPRLSGPADRVCVAFHTRDAVERRLLRVREHAKMTGAPFSMAALVARLL